MSNDQNGNLFNEDAASYEPVKKLTDVFPEIHLSSFEEQSALTRQYSLALSPVERMAHLHQLILIAYAEEMQQPIDELWSKKIIIDEIKW